MKKGLVSKLIVMFVFLPLVAQAAPRLNGSRALKIDSNSKKADIESVLSADGISGVDAEGLMIAVNKVKSVEGNQISDLYNAAGDAKSRTLMVKALSMISEHAKRKDADELESSDTSDKIDAARKKVLELTVAVTSGKKHNKESLEKIINEMDNGYKNGTDATVLALNLNAVLAETASAEAKAEAEKGQDLLDMLGGCSKL